MRHELAHYQDRYVQIHLAKIGTATTVPFSHFWTPIKRPYLVSPRLDEATVALQKEKNMYKEIENFPMCFKVNPCGV